MKKAINLPLCILLGFLIFFFLMFAYGDAINRHYADFYSWINKPSADELLLKNQELATTLKKLQFENAEYQKKINFYKKNKFAKNDSLQAKDKQLKAIENRYLSSNDKLNKLLQQDSERRNLIVKMAKKNPVFEKMYFLFGYGCLYGHEIYSTRENKFLPSSGYCFYKRYGKNELTYYNNSTSTNIAEKIDLLSIASPTRMKTSNEVVFNSHIDSKRVLTKLVLSPDGKYAKKFSLDLSNIINVTKASTISLSDPIDNSNAYTMTVSDWAKAFFLDKGYKEYWNKNVCKDNTDNICVKLQLIYNVGQHSSKTAEIVFIYHYSNINTLTDKNIIFRSSIDNKIIEKHPVDFDELTKLSQESHIRVKTK